MAGVRLFEAAVILSNTELNQAIEVAQKTDETRLI